MSGSDIKRYQGQIVEWSEEKRFGFILPRGSGKGDPVVFLSMSSFQNRKRSPAVGDTVLYDLQTSPHMSTKRLRTPYRAARVTYLGEDPPVPMSRRGRLLFAPLGVVYWCALGTVSAHTGTPQWPAITSLVLSSVAFLVYGWDKLMALKGTSRVPEANLHLISLLGGWPGSALGQLVFAHKTLKAPFQRTFIGTVVVNIVLTAICATVVFSAR